MSQLRVLVCGDRHWQSERSIAARLRKLPPDTTVIHGCARGADRIAGKVAQELGLEVEEYPAMWDVYGRRAGPIRNKQMLVEGKPELVIAFHPDLRKSKGTKNMLHLATVAGVRIERIRV